MASPCFCTVPSYCFVTAYVSRSCVPMLPAPSMNAPTLYFQPLFFIYFLFFCVKYNHLLLLHLSPPPHTHTQPPSQFPSALYLFSLLVAMLQCFMWALQRYTCGVAALVLVVTSKARRVASPIASANWAYRLVCWPGRMYSWRVGGQWGPTEATEVTAIQNPGLPAQRYGLKQDHAPGAEKELLFACFSQRTHAAQPNRLASAPRLCCHVITCFLFSCTTTGIITSALQPIAVIYGVCF